MSPLGGNALPTVTGVGLSLTILIAAMAAFLYLREGSRWLLLLGCGAIVWGLGVLVGCCAGLMNRPGPQVLGYFGGALSSAGLHILAIRPSVATLPRESVAWSRRSMRLRLAYGASVLWVLALGALGFLAHDVALSALKEVDGKTASALAWRLDFSLLSEVLAWGAVLLTLVGAASAGHRFSRSRRPYLYWYALALALQGLGLFALLQANDSNLLIWLSHISLDGSLLLLVFTVGSALVQSQTWALLDLRQAFFAQSPDAICLLSPDGLIVDHNAAAAQILGWADDAPERGPLSQYIAPQDRAQYEALLETLQEGKTIRQVPLEALRRDGSRVPVELSASLLRHTEGARSVLISLRDVSERLERERAIRFQAHLLAAVPQAVIAVDRQGRILFWGRGAERLCGLSAEEALGAPVDQVLPATEADGAWLRMALERAWQGETTSSELNIRHSLPAWVTLSPPDDASAQTSADAEEAGGRVGHLGRQENSLGAIIVASDISELQVMRAALQASARTLRSIVDQSEDGIALMDEQGRIVEWNPALEEISGLAREEMIGTPVWEILERITLSDTIRFAQAASAEAELQQATWAENAHTEETGLPSEGLDKRRIRESVERFAACGEGEWLHELLELKLITSSGERRTVQMAAFPIPTDRGWMAGAIVRDITEWAHMEERLHTSQKLEAVGQLAGGVAHEFNNLLTVINGYAQMLQRQMGPAHPWRDEVDQIYRAGNRAADLVRQLLAYARKQILNIRQIDLNELLAKLEPRLHTLVGDVATLELRFAADLPLVAVDRYQLENMVFSLVENARDAIEAKKERTPGSIVIETALESLQGAPKASARAARLQLAPGCYVTLTVRDNGEGMTEEVKAHLFEPFFSTRGVGKGTGLGLATVYGIAQQLGGTIHVESERGIGTSMLIYLPVGENAAAE